MTFAGATNWCIGFSFPQLLYCVFNQTVPWFSECRVQDSRFAETHSIRKVASPLQCLHYSFSVSCWISNFPSYVQHHETAKMNILIIPNGFSVYGQTQGAIQSTTWANIQARHPVDFFLFRSELHIPMGLVEYVQRVPDSHILANCGNNIVDVTFVKLYLSNQWLK